MASTPTDTTDAKQAAQKLGFRNAFGLGDNDAAWQSLMVDDAANTSVRDADGAAIVAGHAAAAAANSGAGNIAPTGVSAGLHINLIWGSGVASAPSTFKTAMQSAASMLEAAFSDAITINISVGWGEVDGSRITQSGIALGGPASGQWVSYANIKTLLIADASTADDRTAVSSLPAALNPNGNGQIAVWSAEGKALGIVAPTDSGLDGVIGFSTDFPASIWVGAALHELTHAMGRTSGYSAYGIEDMFRFATNGTHAFGGGPAQYFSIDGGATKIANFSTSSDYGDWASDSLSVGDPFNAYISSGANSLTTAGLRAMDVLGFNRVIGATPAPTPTPATLVIAAASANKAEGNSGVTPFTFTVTRAGNTTTAVSATWSVSGSGTNTATAADFQANTLPAGTVSFAAGETSKLITINVLGDTVVEADDTFAVNLTNPSIGATVTTGSAIGTILNDDVGSIFSIAALRAAQNEGNSSSTPFTFTFTVSRTGTISATANVTWGVTGNGATAIDFTGNVLPSGTVSFAAGETSKVITINVAGDTVAEADEGFNVNLTSPSTGSVIAAGTASGTIINDDVAATGMHINLQWGSSVGAAPSAFKTAIQSAATMIERAFKDNITVNIAVGWGEIAGFSITQSNVAVGGAVAGVYTSYAKVKSLLTADRTSSDDNSSVASMPASLNPNGYGNIMVWRAEAKALGVIAGSASGLDGYIGFSTDFPSSVWVGAALHEITRAMGRISGYNFPYGIEDLFRYNAPGSHVYAGGTAAYLSADGGATRIANFSTTANYGDFASDSLTVNDPFNALISTGANTLTAADIRSMDILGFNRTSLTAPVVTTPAVAPIVSADPQGMITDAGLTGAIVSSISSMYAPGDTAAAATGLDAPVLSFIGTPDAVILGDAPATVTYTMTPGSGLETIADFQYGLDKLDIDLTETAGGVLQAFDTISGGVRAISLASSTDLAHGLVLLNMTAGQTAADLLANHTSYSDGHAFIT